MTLTIGPLSYRSVVVVDPLTGNQATVVGGALTTTASGGSGGSVTQGTTPWIVAGGGTAGTAATGVVTVQGIASMTKLLVTPDAVALPAGTAIIGKVGIDQTTPGTTNGVQINAALPAGTNVIGALSANQSVNTAQINGVTPLMGNGVSGTGAQRVTIASDSTGQVTLAAGAATIGALTANQSVNVAQLAGTATSVNNGTVDAGTLRVTLASNGTGQVTLASGAQVQQIPGTSGGLSVTRTIIPNNTTNVIVKASAGQLYAIAAYNNSATIAYIKIYNATSATAGAGTPVDTHLIPAPAAGGGGGIIWSVPNGVAYGTGITFIVTTGIADADTTAPAASTYIVTFYFK